MADPTLTVDLREVKREHMRRIMREAEEARLRRWSAELRAQSQGRPQDATTARIADFVRDEADASMPLGPATAELSPRLRRLLNAKLR